MNKNKETVIQELTNPKDFLKVVNKVSKISPLNGTAAALTLVPGAKIFIPKPATPNIKGNRSNLFFLQTKTIITTINSKNKAAKAVTWLPPEIIKAKKIINNKFKISIFSIKKYLIICDTKNNKIAQKNI